MFRFMKQPLNGHINKNMYKYWLLNNKNIFEIKNKTTYDLKHQQTGRVLRIVEFILKGQRYTF